MQTVYSETADPGYYGQLWLHTNAAEYAPHVEIDVGARIQPMGIMGFALAVKISTLQKASKTPKPAQGNPQLRRWWSGGGPRVPTSWELWGSGGDGAGRDDGVPRPPKMEHLCLLDL